MSSSPPETPDSHRVWLTAMFDRYDRPLVTYARSLLRGDIEGARDAAQDTFLQLCRQPWPDITDKVEGWLFRVCRNRCLDLLKRWETRMQTPVHDQVIEHCLDHRQSDPAIVTIDRESNDHLRCLVQKLSDRQQEVLALRLQQSLSYQQIAEVTGLTVANVGYHLHEAIMRLRQQVNQTD